MASGVDAQAQFNGDELRIGAEKVGANRAVDLQRGWLFDANRSKEERNDEHDLRRALVEKDDLVDRLLLVQRRQACRAGGDDDKRGAVMIDSKNSLLRAKARLMV